MAVIAILTQKGGAGKTTIAGNLAAELLARGRTVRLLDCDPQGSLTTWAGFGPGILADLVERVATIEPASFRAIVERAGQGAERVVIDTPPGFGESALLACLVADLALLPCGASPLDLAAARNALAVVEQARAERGGDRPRAWFIPSRIDARTALGRELPSSLSELGAPVLPSIGARAAIPEAVLRGLTIREYATASAATREFAALALAVEECLR